jgi:protein-tyrosine phosphatase
VIDLHCHILHDLDDGPETAAESMQMAQAFEQNGYRIVVATPHMVPGTTWMPSTHRIKAQVVALNRTIKDEGMKLRIVSGMEIALDPQLLDLLDEDRLLPLGDSSCLLIEPSSQQLPLGWEQVIFSILARGYSILLAHVERCGQLAANPTLVDQLLQSGVYLQVDWGSFLGQYGRTVARTAQSLAKKGNIHCLASDSHLYGVHNLARVQTAGAKLAKTIGNENLHRITVENPRRVLRGEILQSMSMSGEMTGRRRRRWWRFW